MDTQRRLSWKKIQLQHGPAFLTWLQSSRMQWKFFDKLAHDLERYLLGFTLRSNYSQSKREICSAFVKNLPIVLGNCDAPIYDEPLVADAYAYIHLLERYRRFWDVLSALVIAGVLPMKKDGIDVLDVGTGPAPALYAVADFYSALQEYARVIDCALLNTPLPRLQTVESSRGMIHLVHILSEISGRNGPFRASFDRFDGLDLTAHRIASRESRIQGIVDEDYISEKEAKKIVYGKPTWLDEYRYNLCIFSNYFTQPDRLAETERELRSVFDSLRVGGMIIIVGGTEQQYPSIYSEIDKLALNTRAHRIRDVPEYIQCNYNDIYALRIKQSYRRIWDRLERWSINLEETKHDLPLDLWDSNVPYDGPRKFAIRVYRRGRW